MNDAMFSGRPHLLFHDEIFDDELLLSAGTTASTSACTAPTNLSTESLLQSMEAIQQTFRRHQEATMRAVIESFRVPRSALSAGPRLWEHPTGMNSFCGVDIAQSDLAVKRSPARAHRRRRWDLTGRYHARIQKKWNKRFGFVEEPCAFLLNTAAVGLPGGELLLLHPTLMSQLKKVIR